MLQSAIRPHIVLSIWRIPAFSPIIFSIDAFSPVFLDIVRYISPRSKRQGDGYQAAIQQNNNARLELNGLNLSLKTLLKRRNGAILAQIIRQNTIIVGKLTHKRPPFGL